VLDEVLNDLVARHRFVHLLDHRGLEIGKLERMYREGEAIRRDVVERKRAEGTKYVRGLPFKRASSKNCA
jgi:hypothetical protein